MGRNKTFPQGSATYIVVLVACATAFVITSKVPAFGRVLPVDVYVPLHTVLEFSSIVVSFSVFSVGWYGFSQTRNRQDIVIAGIYLTVGLLDLAHTLSYQGMPNFFGYNTPGKAASYWLAARAFDAAALFGAAYVTPGDQKTRVWTPAAVIFPVLTAFTVAAIVTAYDEDISQALFTAEKGLTPLKIAIEYLIVLVYAAAFAAFGRQDRWNPQSSRILQFALIFNIFAELAFTRYISPYDGPNLLGHIFKVVANYLVLRALFVLSLQRPYDEARRHKEAYEREHEIAEYLQQSFLPKAEKAPPGFELEHRYQGAKGLQVGGDFYNMSLLPDGRFCIVIGDVSGKGLKAAIHTKTVTDTLQAYVIEDPEPQSAITRLNRVLCDTLSDGYFVTLFYGLLDTETGRLVYTNAGHEQSIHISNGQYRLLDSTGPVLGIGPNLKFEQAELTIAHDDVFVLMTDGITEARTLGGLLGIDSVARTAAAKAPEGAKSIVESVYRIVEASGILRDDAALIVIKRKTKPGSQ